MSWQRNSYSNGADGRATAHVCFLSLDLGAASRCRQYAFNMAAWVRSTGEIYPPAPAQKYLVNYLSSQTGGMRVPMEQTSYLSARMPTYLAYLAYLAHFR